jgi:ABC-type phosphate transport system substrate-binding protein
MLRSLAAWLLVAAVTAGPARAGDLDFVVIAHPAVSVQDLSLDELARIYKKETTRWPDGSPIVPVELGGAGATRAAFYESTLRLMVGDVTAYWINQAMTTGNNPPKVFSSDSLVLHYVAQTPGAVGFVAPNTPLGDRVKRIAIHE